jgi:hypothetical protein
MEKWIIITVMICLLISIAGCNSNNDEKVKNKTYLFVILFNNEDLYLYVLEKVEY